MTFVDLIRKRPTRKSANANPANVAKDDDANREPLAALAGLVSAEPLPNPQITYAEMAAILVTTLIVHCALADVDAVELEQAWRAGMFEAARQADTEPLEPMMPAEHDPRFWLPEHVWVEQYCKRHQARACDER